MVLSGLRAACQRGPLRFPGELAPLSGSDRFNALLSRGGADRIGPVRPGAVFEGGAETVLNAHGDSLRGLGHDVKEGVRVVGLVDDARGRCLG
jgi:hypothetical protein